jgi:hypothetical protein
MVSNNDPALSPTAPPLAPAAPPLAPAASPLAPAASPLAPAAPPLATKPAKNLFTSMNMLIAAGVVGAYFILHMITGRFFGASAAPSTLNMGISRTIDALFLLVFAALVYMIYETYKDDPDVNFLGMITTQFSDYISDPMSSFTTGLFLIVFYTIIYLFSIPNEKDTKPIVLSIVENAAWIILVISLFVDFFTYSLGVSFYELFPFLDFSKKTLPPTDPSATTDSSHGKEVFNVSNNLYTYDEAQAVCKVFDSDVATYSQVENAYNNGAEWCNYGWSDGQMALFPTQTATWDKLQKQDANRSKDSTAPSVKNNCGRPGVNGGYIANPYVRFGVNCYGKKPVSTEADMNRLMQKQTQVYPKSPAEIALEQKVEYWKSHKEDMLNVNSYNTVKWSGRDSKPLVDK